MSDQLHIQKVLIAASFSIILISCICWGKIINDNFHREIAVEDQISSEVQQMRSNALVFSGAMVVLARVVSIATSEE